MKIIVAGALILSGLTAPAFAQQYYIERDPDTQDCRVVETTTVIEPAFPIIGRIFGNRAEAESEVSVLCAEEPAPVVVERERAPVIVERERAPVVIERERDPVIIERDIDDRAVVIERDEPVIIDRY